MEVLHRDEVLTSSLADIVNLHDVLVVQAGGDASLVKEHANKSLIPRILGSNPLEHYMALEAFDPICPPEEDISHTSRHKVLEHHVPT